MGEAGATPAPAPAPGGLFGYSATPAPAPDWGEAFTVSSMGEEEAFTEDEPDYERLEFDAQEYPNAPHGTPSYYYKELMDSYRRKYKRSGESRHIEREAAPSVI